MNALKLWFKRTNITTHTVWIFLLSFAGLFNGSAAFRNQIEQLFVGHPVVVTKLGFLCSNLVILAGIWAKISHPSKPEIAPVSPAESVPSVPTLTSNS